LPDPQGETERDERDRDGKDAIQREPELRARPALAAPQLSRETASDEPERALSQERDVERVYEDVIAVELEDRKQVDHELEDEQEAALDREQLMARRGELAQPHTEAEEGEREHDRRAGAREREPAAGAVEHVDEAFGVVPRGDVPDHEAPQPSRHADDRIAPRAPDAGT